MLRYHGQHGEMCLPNPGFKQYRCVRDAIKTRVLAGNYFDCLKVKYAVKTFVFLGFCGL